MESDNHIDTPSVVNFKHPILYTVFKTNAIIEADKNELTNISEIRLYNFILNNNHIEDDGLVYRVPFDNIFVSGESQLVRDVKSFTLKVQKRTIYMDENLMQEIFNENVRASIVPFPTIKFDIDKKYFEVHINKYFKTLLSEAKNLGFTKGDYDQLVSLNKNMNTLYWYFRRLQRLKKVWVLDIDRIRKDMKIKAYKDFRNFRRHILDRGVKEFKGTWTEFEWKPKELGKAGKIESIEISFKQGPIEEKVKPAGFGHRWEKDLIEHDINPTTIIAMRHKCDNSEKEFGDFCGKYFIWSNSYIIYSLEAARKEWKRKQKKGTTINNTQGWIIKGLKEGQWNDYVEKQPLDMSDLK